MPGNHFRKAGPKSVTRIAPSTNSGITASDRPVTVMTRSVGRPRRIAATTPPPRGPQDLADRDAAEVDYGDAVRHVAVHLRAGRRDEVVEVRVDRRRVLEQDRLHLPRVLLLVLQPDRGLEVVHCPVERLVV